MLRANRGFTLIEILIALAILAMIVASTFTIFRSSAKSWQKGEIRTERYHNARTAIGRMSQELSQAVMTGNAECRFTGAKGEVKFISFMSTRAEVFEPSEITYWLDKENKYLMRNGDIEPDYDFSTQDYSDILADGISELEFSYYDGSAWNDTWDSSASEDDKVLPKAVKIKIKVEDKSGKESEFFEVITHLKTA